MRRLLCTIAYMALGCSAVLAVGDNSYLKWSELPQLPPATGQQKQTGLAGSFVGTHNGALIVAGGVNFPDALPWEGGKKLWQDNIFVLQETTTNTFQWFTDKSFKLPRSLAYGVAISTNGGVVCIGGCGPQGYSDDVFLLKWNPATKKIDVESMPSLPRQLAFMAGAVVDNIIYIAGGQEAMKDASATKNFWALDLSKRADKAAFVWKELPAWPGPARILSAAAGQSDGMINRFYLFSGRNVSPDMETKLLTDAYSYNPKTGLWKQLANVAPKGQSARCIMTATAVTSGANHILVFGSADVLAYHTITDTWATVSRLPTSGYVPTAAVEWDDSFVVPGGKIQPGAETATVWRAEALDTRPFGWINYSVIGVYLLLLVAMGIYFSRREKTTDDFFKAGGRVPWWAAGLSIFGTQLSAVTFMAIPAKTFATDWRYFMGNMAIIMVAPFVIIVFLPFYRRLNLTTAYEYLEKRFNLAARLFGSTMFITLQFSRIGIVLFLPSIALSVVTGIDIRLCILVMGILSIVYTVLGGIEAVIWTDVVQVLVLLGGAMLCLFLLFFNLEEGGISRLLKLTSGANKLHIFDFTFNLNSPTIWVVLISGLVSNFIVYGSDQTVIQRYLTTKDEKSAANSIWTNAILTIPASLLFFGIGTALFLFYKTQPELLNPTLSNADSIFPWYIITQLPRGISGLLIAAVFAAAMSSLDSSMNSVATAVTTDFYRRFKHEATDRMCLNVARWVTVIVGVAGTAFALMMTGWDIKSVWDQLILFVGLFASGLGGLFVLGIFSRRAHGVGAIVGLVGSGLLQYIVSRFELVYFLFYVVTGFTSCVIIGYVASLIIPTKKKTLDGLTIYTMPRRTDDGHDTGKAKRLI